MKVEIRVVFAYGAYDMVFKKIFELDFAPYYDLIISDENDYENYIELVNNHYISTRIYYNPKSKDFYVEVRHNLLKIASIERIDDELKVFKETGWEKIEDDSKDMKELINREAAQK